MSMTEDKTTFTRGGIAWESVNEADRISPKLGTHVFMWDTVTGKTSWVPLALLRNSAVCTLAASWRRVALCGGSKRGEI